jgi:hypothetical protein
MNDDLLSIAKIIASSITGFWGIVAVLFDYKDERGKINKGVF